MIKKLIESLELNKHEKMSTLFAAISTLFVCAYVVSNVVAVKSVSLFGIVIGGQSISLASSFLVFPITYIISDIFSEVYGYAWSRKISWFAFIINLTMVGLITLTVVIPGADPEFDVTYKSVLGSSFGIVMASQIAFMFGDFANDKVFQKMKANDKTNSDFSFVLRSMVSSLFGEIFDSFVFLPLLYLAIGAFGTLIKSPSQFFIIVIAQGIVKTAMELIVAPLEVFVVKKIKLYEANCK